MVYGQDLCEMLGLFHDIAEAVALFNEKKVAELEKFKIAYNNRVRRDKRKEKEVAEEKKRNELEDEEMTGVRRHNTELLVRNADLQ